MQITFNEGKLRQGFQEYVVGLYIPVIVQFQYVPDPGAIYDFSPTLLTPLNTVKLGGIWKGIEITEEDIESIRKEMWKNFGK